MCIKNLIPFVAVKFRESCRGHFPCRNAHCRVSLSYVALAENMPFLPCFFYVELVVP